MLGATVTQTMLAGTCLIVTGTVMAVQFSSKETLELGTSDIKKLYHNPAYVSYLILMGGFLVVLHIVYKKLNERKKINEPVKHSDIIVPCIYSVSSALFGTQSVVQAKVLAELSLSHSLDSTTSYSVMVHIFDIPHLDINCHCVAEAPQRCTEDVQSIIHYSAVAM